MATDLSPSSNDYIDFLVHTGRFASRGAALDEAVYLLQEKELRRQLEQGIRELDNGEGIHINSEEEAREFFEGIKRRTRESLAANEKMGP